MAGTFNHFSLLDGGADASIKSNNSKKKRKAKKEGPAAVPTETAPSVSGVVNGNTDGDTEGFKEVFRKSKTKSVESLALDGSATPSSAAADVAGEVERAVSDLLAVRRDVWANWTAQASGY